MRFQLRRKLWIRAAALVVQRRLPVFPQRVQRRASSKRNELLAEATTKQTENVIKELYHSDKGVGDGGTADVIRYERATGDAVGGKSHELEGRERLKQIERILKKIPIIQTENCLNDLGMT